MKSIKSKNHLKKKRRRYDAEFRKRALQMVEDGRSVQQVSDALGIKRSLLYSWRRKEKEAEPIEQTAEAERIKELEKQLFRMEQERDILKKALSIFSQQY